jgi:protoporphyrinogen oxidase
VHLGHRIVDLELEHEAVTAVKVLDERSGSTRRVPCDHFISTMPVRDLVGFLRPPDSRIRHVAAELPYRAFVTAGLLLRRMQFGGRVSRVEVPGNGMPPDNWIYIQEPDVRIGRLQIFNNWSPAMVADPATIWLGLEYFCTEGDDLWSMQEGSLLDFAAGELVNLGMVDRNDVLDGTVVRVAKAYPAYFGTYGEFGKVRNYLDHFRNVYPIGRNGMHRYNNQDHSMLAANGAVSAILLGGIGKSKIWEINEESDYHEEIAHDPVGQIA